MDTKKLTLFTTLAELKHFNRAAEKCHVSPSKLSRVIQSIENELDIKLFDRNNRSVALTAQGLTFLQHARDSIQQWETIQDRLLAEKDSLNGSISIYCSVTASYSFLYDILKDFRAKHPQISITLHTGDPADALSRITAGQEDIAITAKLEAMPQGTAFKRFTDSPLVFIAPLQHHFLPIQTGKQNTMFWKDIPMIMSEKGIARERLDAWFGQNQVTPNIYAQVAGHEAIVSMVSLGFGVGLVPKIVLDNSPLANRVKLFEVQAKLAPYEVGVCVLEKRLKSPIVAALWSQVAT